MPCDGEPVGDLRRSPLPPQPPGRAVAEARTGRIVVEQGQACALDLKALESVWGQWKDHEGPDFCWKVYLALVLVPEPVSAGCGAARGWLQPSGRNPDAWLQSHYTM